MGGGAVGGDATCGGENCSGGHLRRERCGGVLDFSSLV